MLRKTGVFTKKVIDGNALREHIGEGSKRFEEQQASEDVADPER